MLRVRMTSGREVAVMSLQEFGTLTRGAELPLLVLKRHLHKACGQPRFKQRLLCEDGTILADDLTLDKPFELQLLCLPYCSTSEAEEAELLSAVEHNDVLGVEHLLNKPQDPNLGIGSRVCASGDYARSCTTPLYEACWHGHVEVARLLLEAGADKDRSSGSSGLTPLGSVCRRGHGETVRLLLGARADVDHPDDRGATPLSWACDQGHLGIAQLLLEQGADKHKADDLGLRPLAFACEQNHVEVARLLLRAKAHLDAADHMGSTALSWACQRGHVQVARLLLEERAIMDQADQSGRTPLSWAYFRGHVGLVRLLREAADRGLGE